MASRIKIEILSHPADGDHLFFTVTSGSPAHLHVIDKEFFIAPGPPPNDGFIKVVANIDTVRLNVFNNLAASEADSHCYFTIEGDVIYMNFTDLTDVTLDVDTPYGWQSITLETTDDMDDPVVVPEVPVGVNDFEILIIDTYTNTLPLVDELTSGDSPPVLKYDGGDDVSQALMTSELNFNMLVPDASDAHFLHLFTGDEMRYKVELNAVDADGNAELIWQGFLLPDQYKEPYVNGCFFVDFTAVDMLASLKGKYFDPWVYYQKFTNPELFAMILALTGLSQRMVVKPTLVNSDDVAWESQIVSLLPYIKDGKRTDVYAILQDVLESQCLTLLSLRGNWVIEGFTRKGEQDGECYTFSETGERLTEDPGVYRKFLNSLVAEKGSMSFNSVTPFKSVEIDFNVDSSKNLFPDDVVKRVAMFCGYTADAFDEDTPATTNFRQWIKVGGSFMFFNNPQRAFAYGPVIMSSSAILDYFSYSEAQALVNYYECPARPYVSPSKIYELEIEVEADLRFSFPVITIQDLLDEGRFNNIVPFVLLLNGQEIRSNRPSAETLSVNRWDSKQDSVKGDNMHWHTVTYKLKREFTVGEDGNLVFRVLTPIGDFGSAGISDFKVRFNTLKINVVDGDSDESIRAIRDINFTQVKHVTLPITCSVNTAIPNSFLIGARVGPREMAITTGTQISALYYQVFPPVNDLEFQTYRFAISDALMQRLFTNAETKSVFLEKAAGGKVHFYSLYGRREYVIGTGLVNYLNYLTDYEGRPFLPKDYRRLPQIVAGDVLKMLLSDFTAEDYSQREYWHVYGFWGWDVTYPKAVANAYHAVRPVPFFNLECTVFSLNFPDQLPAFHFAGADRVFIPTRLEIDLFNGKTRMNTKESVLAKPEDISYE